MKKIWLLDFFLNYDFSNPAYYLCQGRGYAITRPVIHPVRMSVCEQDYCTHPVIHPVRMSVCEQDYCNSDEPITLKLTLWLGLPVGKMD